MANPNPSAESKSPGLQEEPSDRADVLSGENYPELKLRIRQKLPPEAKGAEAAVPEPARGDGGAWRDVEEGRLLDCPPETWPSLLTRLLGADQLPVFLRGAEQLVTGLESDRIEIRRGALETIRALGESDSQALIPPATLSLFLAATGRCLNAETDDAVQDLAAECTALLVGSVATAGDLEGACGHLARIIRYAGPAGPDLRQRILSSMSLGLIPLRLFAREGRSVLESLVLPLFRHAGADGCRGLIRRLEAEENRQRRSRILEILKALAPLSSEPVKESLEASNWYLVRNALHLLGELGDPSSFEAASRFLEYPDPRIRCAAVRAFWKTGGPCAESYLVDLLPRCDAETQSEILVGLVQVRAASAVAPIAQLVVQSEEALRIKAIEALGQLGPLAPADAIPTLARCLARQGRILKNGESCAVREAAARALMAIGTPEATRALGQAVLEAPRNGDQETLRKILEHHTRA